MLCVLNFNCACEIVFFPNYLLSKMGNNDASKHLNWNILRLFFDSNYRCIKIQKLCDFVYFLVRRKYEIIFFLWRFSFMDTGNSQDSRGRDETIFIPLCHFHPLTKIQTYIINFVCEMTLTHFNCTTCIYQTATQWDCYHLIELPFDWLMMWC